MKALRTGILGTVTAVAIFAFPSVSNAEYFIPPGNSAANQYTESVPTAGGHRDVQKEGKSKPSPAKVLGKDNAKRLQDQGEQGRKAAAVAAATAPSPVVTESTESEGEGAAAGGAGDDGNGGGGQGGSIGAGHPANPVGAGNGTPQGRGGAAEVSGSSGLGEVLGQATGSSSGQMGLLLPLLLIAALVWAVLAFRKQRSSTAP